MWQECVCFLETFWQINSRDLCANKLTLPSHLSWNHKFTYQRELRWGTRKTLPIYQSRSFPLPILIPWVLAIVVLSLCRMGKFWMASLRSVRVKDGCQGIKRYHHTCPSCWLCLDHYNWNAGETLKEMWSWEGPSSLTMTTERNKEKHIPLMVSLDCLFCPDLKGLSKRPCPREWQ